MIGGFWGFITKSTNEERQAKSKIVLLSLIADKNQIMISFCKRNNECLSTLIGLTNCIEGTRNKGFLFTIVELFNTQMYNSLPPRTSIDKL